MDLTNRWVGLSVHISHLMDSSQGYHLRTGPTKMCLQSVPQSYWLLTYLWLLPGTGCTLEPMCPCTEDREALVVPPHCHPLAICGVAREPRGPGGCCYHQVKGWMLHPAGVPRNLKQSGLSLLCSSGHSLLAVPLVLLSSEKATVGGLCWDCA